MPPRWARPDGYKIRSQLPMSIAYLLFAASGTVALAVQPSTALENQGGKVIVVAWGVLCLTVSVLGLIGIFFRQLVIELIGTGLASSASLVLSAALTLQAVTTASAVPLTSACATGALSFLFAQRFRDRLRSPDRM